MVPGGVVPPSFRSPRGGRGRSGEGEGMSVLREGTVANQAGACVMIRLCCSGPQAGHRVLDERTAAENKGVCAGSHKGLILSRHRRV